MPKAIPISGMPICSSTRRITSIGQLVFVRAAAVCELAPLVGAQVDDSFERRDVRGYLVEHRDVIRGLERTGGDENAAARLLEGIGELARSISRIDVDED